MTKENISEISLEEVLSTRLSRWDSIGNKGNKSKEKQLTDYIDIHLPSFLRALGFGFLNIAKEFTIKLFRLDYLVKLDNEEYLIIEVKNSDSERDYVSGVGQLLAYRMMVSCQFGIPLNRIKMALFIDRDSVVVFNTIHSANLPIDVYVVCLEGIKVYGKS